MQRPILHATRFRMTARVLALGLLAPGLMFLAPEFGPSPALAAAGTTGNITDYNVSSTANPHGIAAGPDGKVWFTDNNAPGVVGTVDPVTGVTATFQPTTISSSPEGIAAGSDGRMWFAERSANQIGAVTPAGAFTEYPITTTSSQPFGITEGSDNNIWFAEGISGGKIGRITPSGVRTEFPLSTFTTANGITADGTHIWISQTFSFIGPSPLSSIRELNVADGTTANTFAVTATPVATSVGLRGIAVGSDSQVYFAASTAKYIGKMDPNTGSFTTTTVSPGSPVSVTKGADGNIWFTVNNTTSGDYIGQLTPSGTLTKFPTGIVSPNQYFSINAAPVGITTGPEGNIWASAQLIPNNEILRLEVQPTATVAPATLPFGNQSVGTTSTAQTATFSISGGGAATITAVPSATGDFAVTASTCTNGTAVPANGSCTLQVAFAPTTAGARTGTLSVTSTASNSPQTVALTGTGVPGTTVTVTAGVNPALTNFYSQAIGTTSTARTITLVNGGATTMTVSAVGITGTSRSDFTIAPGSDNCTNANVGPSGFCTVRVVFNPSAEGGRQGVIYFVDNATTGAQLGVLIGRGVHQAGYWLSASDGGIFAFPAGAPFYGSTGSIALNKPIVGIAGTPDSGGYWEVATDGGIFAFGDAQFYGSTGSIKLNNPIVGMASTPTGLGYWLTASDGGIFAFGDAQFYGSTGSIKLNKPIVGMAATQDGGGYWLVATDGGIFAFGDAGFHQSTGSMTLNKPIVGMAPNHDGSGYWLVASDGGVFAFNAPFLGSTGSIKLNKPIVGMAPTPTGNGYWMVATDGGIFSFPDAAFFGSTGSITLNKPIIGMAPIL